MKIYYLNSTHWDREWYLPFQGFRFNLVDMLDDLIEIMENDPEYKLFCIDGQTIVLEDYAEIQPEKAERLKALIKAGRIKVGPWYVMPDEFLLSGESLIRNLMIGHSIAEKWGGSPWKYGYVNDIFGHIAQMPQIFSGFDINGAYIGRGLGNTDFNHFVWKSPDGTECYTSISNYGVFTRNEIPKFGSEEFPEILKRHIDTAASRSDAPIVFFSNTDDHKKATAFTPKVLQLLRELYPDAEVVDTDLSQMVEELKKYKSVLPIISGELNRPLNPTDNPKAANLTLLYNCLSSYYTIKRENDYCQNLLEKRIEPMVAMSNADGNYINHRFVEAAYKHLVQNHPHDSICGCSADQVHKDMLYRFDQVKEISDRLYDRFLEFKRDVHWHEGTASEYELKFYNMRPFECEEYRTVKVDFYRDFVKQRRGYAEKEAVNNFRIFDCDGNEIPYQLIHIDRGVNKRMVSVFQSEATYDVYTIALKVKLPAFGYKLLKILPSETKVLPEAAMPHGFNWAENDFVRLTVLNDGTLEIFDKRSGRVYTGLNAFADNGEVGDGWRHQSPVNDYTVYSYGTNAAITLITAGAAAVTFKIEKEISIPAFLDGTTYCRSEEKKSLKISYTVTLKRDSEAVAVEMQIDNNARDHRLKALFPTGVEGDTYFAGQAFYCVERKTGMNHESLAWQEPEQAEKNMNGIIGKRGQDGVGLAFISAEGLHEAACLDDRDATVAVTLFRCFDRVFLQTRSERSQLQQKLCFKYALMPLSADTAYAEILKVQHDLADTDIYYSKRVLDGSELGKPYSYFEFDNASAVLSVFKCAEDKNGYIIRAFNASDEPIKNTVSVNMTVEKAYLTNMNEDIIKELDYTDGKLTLSFAPWEIKTVRLC